MSGNTRDHGGGLDAAIARYGGTRPDWIDLSTGINPVPYPIPKLSADSWTALPDTGAASALEQAARKHWNVPEEAGVLAAPGASCLIATIPHLARPGQVHIPTPTYNEHAAAFANAGWSFGEDNPQAQVLVHPNNPTGKWYTPEDLRTPFCIVDESFGDVAPTRSLIAHSTKPGHLVLKSFGKFWGLAGLRLGFAIGDPLLVQQLRDRLGPWPVSGPALDIATAALNDEAWARDTRTRINKDAARLDAMVLRAGARLAGGTSLFRLYNVHDASAWQERLAQHRICSRIFPYSDTYLRLGLPAPDAWPRIEAAL